MDRKPKRFGRFSARFSANGPWLCAAWTAFSLLFASSAVRAADPPGDETEKPATKPEAGAEAADGSEPAADEASAEAPGATPPDAKAEAAAEPAPVREPSSKLTPPPSDVARWPGEAFPSDPLRGIHGGSLWMTFHGLQWPVSPFDESKPSTRLGFSGSVWIDTGYKVVKSEQDVPTSKKWLQQGRFVLRATPTYTKGDWFVQGQGELVANKDQSVAQPYIVDADDLWVRAGSWGKFDVQAGRFEAWELYHLGMGLDQDTLEREGADNGMRRGPEFYGVTYAYYRPKGLGNVAIHAYPLKFLRFELLGQIGNEANLNQLTIRPAAILDLGMLKLRGGVEYKKVSATRNDNQTDQLFKGGGGSIQFIYDPYFEVGANGAMGIVDKTDAQGAVDFPGSVTTFSLGGFGNARVIENLVIGVGANYTKSEDLAIDAAGNVGEFGQLQAYGAVQYLLLDQLFIKAVGAYAKSDFAPSFSVIEPNSDSAISGRVRFLYLF